MVKIEFLGGCREVGRSAILIESESGTKCLLDYGIRLTEEDRFPFEVKANEIKAIALTHCHIDHSGALPIIYKGKSPSLLTNAITLAVIEVLIRDMIRVSNYSYPFGLKEINKLIRKSVFLDNKTRYKIGDNFYITFINAGHVPGSVSILIDVDNKKILYTGDINTQNTMLIRSFNSLDIPALDAFIVESTYALREHPNRESLEKEFIDAIINITENGGLVLIPAFGVARSQEILLILNKYGYSGKIFIDGMAKRISNLYLNYPKEIKNFSAYRKSLRSAKFITRTKMRAKIKKESGVIIAPSGMMRGGTAIDYAKKCLNDPNSAIYLVGYQVDGSPGRKLLDNGVFEYEERFPNNIVQKKLRIKALCDIAYYDFSSHIDGVHLVKLIENIKFKNNSKETFCVHGDSKSTTTLSREFVKRGYNSVAPEIGETYKI
ncbi:MAG: MBL fold metallo-hydrolase [Promethearchaeota archaeon]